MRSGSRPREHGLAALLRAPLRLETGLAFPQLFALFRVVAGTHASSDFLEAAAQAFARRRLPDLVCVDRSTWRAPTGWRRRGRARRRICGRRAVRTDPARVRLVGARVRLARPVGENGDVVDRTPIDDDCSQRELRWLVPGSHRRRLARERALRVVSWPAIRAEIHAHSAMRSAWLRSRRPKPTVS